MRRIICLVAVAVLMALMLVAMAAPAFAFVHDVTPVQDCAATTIAGDNELAEDNLPKIPVGNVEGHAPTDVPCHR